MEIFPAIDLKDGCAVRLVQGDYDKKTVYSSDPLSVAAGFAADGAKNLHIVDLDGALAGEPKNFGVIAGLIKNSGLFCQIGGGIRDMERIEKYITAGAGRVILGTAAAADFGLVERAAKQYPGKIAVGVDAKNGFLATQGWKCVTDIRAEEFCEKLLAAGIDTVIYTDIAKDGMGEGTNLELYRKLARLGGLNVIASGGISFIDEIAELRDIGIYGAIIGKAMYTGALDLKDALGCAGGAA